jgi:acetyl esterase/lipase
MSGCGWRCRWFAVVCWALGGMLGAVDVSAQAADNNDPLAGHPRFLVWPKGAPLAVGDEPADQPSLTVYAPKENATDTGIVVCPGGGYGGLALGHEGHEIGEWLSSQGITAFILKYRLAPRYRHPAPMNDVQRAMQVVKSQAAEWKLSPDRIGLLGFSAGGHLASTGGTHFVPEAPDSSEPVMRVNSRPAFLILCYPVITMRPEITHGGSRKNLLGPEPTAELEQLMSNELQVTTQTPPTFLFHTVADVPVLPENSLLFAKALREAKVPFELHLFEFGQHGVGLAKGQPGTEEWPDLAIAWLKRHEFLRQPAAK